MLSYIHIHICRNNLKVSLSTYTFAVLQTTKCVYFLHIPYELAVRSGALQTLCYKPEGCGFIPGGVSGIFHWHDPSCLTTVLGSIQPLTEMNTRNISWGVKMAGEQGWQHYYLHVQTVKKSVSLRVSTGIAFTIWDTCFIPLVLFNSYWNRCILWNSYTLTANYEKIKYMVKSRDHNAGEKHYISTGNESFERTEQSKYLGKP